MLQKPLAESRCWRRWRVTHGSDAETVTAVLDAGRAEVFAGEYRVDGNRAAKLREYIVKTDALLAGLALSSSRIVTPDAKVAEALQGTSGHVTLIDPLHAGDIGRIGLRKLLAGETTDAANLDANYIRRSDAELFSPKR